MIKTIVTMVKTYLNGDAACFVCWDRESNIAEEYLPSDPARRWKAEVSLVDDTLTIIVPWDERHIFDDKEHCPFQLNAKIQIESNGTVWFKGVETCATGECEANVYVLADSHTLI